MGFNNAKIIVNGKTVPTIIPNNDIETIKKIFDMYANTNMSLGGIAKTLAQEHKTMYNNVKIARILHNPAYVKADVDIFAFYKSKNCIVVNDIDEFNGVKGCNLYGKRDRGKNKYNITEQHVLSLALHEGIVDSDTFLKCQDKLSGNKQIKNTGKGKHTWMTGLVKCGYCGYTMNARVIRGYRYLKCRGREIYKNCLEDLHSYNLSEIEDEVLNHIINEMERIKQKKQTHNETPPERPEINEYKRDIYVIEQEIQSLISAIPTANEVVMKYINEKVSELDKRKAGLTLLVASQRKTEPISIPEFKEISTLDMEAKKELAQSLINKINIFKDEIKITWKY